MMANMTRQVKEVIFVFSSHVSCSTVLLLLPIPTEALSIASL